MSTPPKQTNSGDIPARQVSEFYRQRLADYLHELLGELTHRLDVRLVRTFVGLLLTVLGFRHRNNGLLLTELGERLLSPDHAPAATKRISNLLRSPNWSHHLLDDCLWQKAKAYAEDLQQRAERVLLLWDESVVEKAETLRSPDLGAVRSSKARRLKRIRPGYYHPPTGKPVCVPGLEWVGLLVAGLRQTPCLGGFEWWTRRGPHARQRMEVLTELLERAGEAFADRVWHVFDRGYASRHWLGHLLTARVGFVVRWQTHYHLVGPTGVAQPTWQLTRGKRSQGQRLIYDAVRKCHRKAGVVFQPVRHADYPDQPLWLVVSRPGKHLTPWYLLTNQPVGNVEQAWQVVFAYARRWQIEAAFRYTKTELALESPRLWFWQNRLKLMMMVALLYGFLLSLVRPEWGQWQEQLLRAGCHRTGKRYREASIPLYRIRIALAYVLKLNSG